MDAKPFINGNKLTKPDFGYYRPIQNDNIVILAATLEGDDSIEVPPEVEPFIKAWGTLSKSMLSANTSATFLRRMTAPRVLSRKLST